MAGANVSKAQAYHGTTTNSYVDTVVITGQYRKIKIVNRSAVELYYTISFGGAPATPTVAGDNCLVLEAVIGASAEFTIDSASLKNTKVLLIASSPCSYTIQGLQA